MEATHGYVVEESIISSPKTMALAGAAPNPNASAITTAIDNFFKIPPMSRLDASKPKGNLGQF
jgi:hypothetical protein